MRQPGNLFHSARCVRHGSYKKTVMHIEPASQKVNAYLDYVNCFNVDKTVASPGKPEKRKAPR